MKPNEFVGKYLPYARQSEEKTKASALAVLAQCALETGWGKHCPGNMMFGIKAGKNWQGKKQLVTTTEYHGTPDVKYPEIISVTPVVGKYKYRVKDWFRAYDSPEESFTDHIGLLLSVKRYEKAAMVRSDPYRFIEEIHKAGYATDPGYTKKLHMIIRMIEKIIKQ